MATERQKKLAKAIVENSRAAKPLNKQELVVSSGYGIITADRHSKEIMEQKGVQKELAVLGFTEENAMKVVQEIMLDARADKPSRLKASDMVFKVHGTYAPEKRKIEATIDANDSRLDSLIEQLENEIDEGT